MLTSERGKQSIMEATHMKLVAGVISTAVLSFTLGVPVVAYAQQEQHDQQEEQKAKPAQEEKKAQPESGKQENKSVKPEEKAPERQKSAKQEEAPAAQQKNSGAREEKTAQQPRAAEAKPEQQAHSGAKGGGRIPDDRFRANFGKEHTFRVTQADYRNHRFQYGGYWFGFAEPWPSNWLYTQDVYVIDINGVYYLCNASYPGVNLALSFTL